MIAQTAFLPLRSLPDWRDILKEPFFCSLVIPLSSAMSEPNYVSHPFIYTNARISYFAALFIMKRERPIVCIGADRRGVSFVKMQERKTHFICNGFISRRPFCAYV